MPSRREPSTNASRVRNTNLTRAIRVAQRLEAALWTGRVGHFLGGALDLAEAFARHAAQTRRASARRGAR
jgi:hypothetical protein